MSSQVREGREGREGRAQYSLRWNEHGPHVTSALGALRGAAELADVTLACEGGKIRAHKLLLSVCSGYLRDVFRDNPCRHPVVVFRDVKYEDLAAIVDFMYYGEVSVLQERLEAFLVAAELLEVKGLTDGGDDEPEPRARYPSAASTVSYADPALVRNAIYETTDVQLAYEEPINLATSQTQNPYDPAPSTSRLSESEPSTYDNVRRDDADVVLDEQALQNDPVRTSTIIVNQNLGEDMQVDHQNLDNNVTIEDLSDKSNGTESDLAKFRCQLCPKGFKHPTSLTLHKDSHTGKTQCPVCHRSFSRSYDMRSHLQKIHQGKQLTIKEIRYKVSNELVAPKTFTHHI